MNTHECKPDKYFVEVYIDSYPRFVRRCFACGRVMGLVPFDDLSHEELTKAIEAVKRWNGTRRREHE
jgi:hypothetical protein